MSDHSSSRWHFLDMLRGFTLINMILFHFLYDIFIIYGRSPSWLDSPLPNIWQEWICCTFIIIAGIVFHFSHSHWKRGLLLNAWGFVITFITVFAIPHEAVWFGILNLIGTAILLTALLQPLLKKIPSKAGLFLSLLLFLISQQVPYGALGCYNFRFLELPESLYQYFPCAWLGFPPAGFSSSDYFSLIPWVFIFWIGYYLFPFLKNEPLVKLMSWNPLPPLTFIGRKTLWVYMLHQPVLMMICMVIFRN